MKKKAPTRRAVILLNLGVPLDVLDQFVVALARVRAFVREGAQL